MDKFLITKQVFLRVRHDTLKSVYEVHPKYIFECRTHCLLRVREGTGSPWRVAKMIRKAKYEHTKMVVKEVGLLKKLDHPHVIRIYDVFEDEETITVVKDFCEGGELFELITEKGPINENKAKTIIRQLTETLVYCHSHHIVHRDIKAENVLLIDKHSIEIKLINFGFALEWKQSVREELKTSKRNVVGTPYYISPDILTQPHNYDEKTDVWSLGVLLYVMVTATPPFDGYTEQAIFKKITNYSYGLNTKQLKEASPQLKDLIKKILVPPVHRLTLQEILEHPWLQNLEASQKISLDVVQLKKFANYNRTKKLAAHLIASQLPLQYAQQLQRLFRQIDTNRDGELSVEEMRAAMEKEGMRYSEIRVLMSSIDANHNNRINYTEFLASIIGDTLFTQDNLKKVFRVLDRDGNGMVERQELLELFRECGLSGGRGRDVEAIVEECDKDGNGMIDFQEFQQCVFRD